MRFRKPLILAFLLVAAAIATWVEPIAKHLNGWIRLALLMVIIILAAFFAFKREP